MAEASGLFDWASDIDPIADIAQGGSGKPFDWKGLIKTIGMLSKGQQQRSQLPFQSLMANAVGSGNIPIGQLPTPAMFGAGQEKQSSVDDMIKLAASIAKLFA